MSLAKNDLALAESETKTKRNGNMKIKNKKDSLTTVLGDLRYVELDHLAEHEDIENREIDSDHVEMLKNSIAKDGLTVPVIVWDGGNKENMMEIKVDGKKTQVPATFLVGGFHRREAIRNLRKEDSALFKKRFSQGVPTIVVHGDLQDALLAQLRENVARENPSPQDILPFVKRLLDDGMKRVVIAKRIGRSPTWISEVMSIDEELGEEGAEDFKKGDIDLTEGIKAAKKVKSGKMSKKEALDEAKAKTKKKKDRGSSRAEKRVSIKKLKEAYDALPNMPMGARLQVAEGIIYYASGETDIIPKKLVLEKPEEENEEKGEKKSKKSKKFERMKKKSKEADEEEE